MQIRDIFVFQDLAQPDLAQTLFRLLEEVTDLSFRLFAAESPTVPSSEGF